MQNRTIPTAPAARTRHVVRHLLIAALAFPFIGCAKTPPAKPAQIMPLPATSSTAAQQTQAPSEESDCLTISSLAEKRACMAKQDDAFIEECERIRPGACVPYHQMHTAEQTLLRSEVRLLESAQQAYASYIGNDPAYLEDLATHAHDANTAWRAYRDAQCALEPFAEGMSRSESENLAEACRLTKTQARIAELDALKAASGR